MFSWAIFFLKHCSVRSKKYEGKNPWDICMYNRLCGCLRHPIILPFGYGEKWNLVRVLILFFVSCTLIFFKKAFASNFLFIVFAKRLISVKGLMQKVLSFSLILDHIWWFFIADCGTLKNHQIWSNIRREIKSLVSGNQPSLIAANTGRLPADKNEKGLRQKITPLLELFVTKSCIETDENGNTIDVDCRTPGSISSKDNVKAKNKNG